MAGLDFADKIKEATEGVQSNEQLIGIGLLQPFNGCNAGVI